MEEKEAEAEKIRQETEQAKEDWEKVQIDKDKVQDSYKYYKKLAEGEKGMYELYYSWCGDEKKTYEDYAGKSRELKLEADALGKQVRDLEKRKSDKTEKVQAEEIKLDIVKLEL